LKKGEIEGCCLHIGRPRGATLHATCDQDLADFAKLADETEKWAKVIRAANIRLD
jgi:hypothetical protein